MFARLINLLRFPCSRVVLVLVLAIASRVPARSQATGASVDTLISASPGDTLLMLGTQFVLPGSLTLSLGADTLVPGSDFILDGRNGVVRFSAPAASYSRDATGSAIFRARYEFLPFTFRDAYRLRSPVILRDTATGRVDTIYRTAADFTSEDFFGTRLRKSGSLVRGVQAGSDRDLTLNSGFRLQMSGNLSDDLEILASLTDENSPLQAEGTTQSLQELDRVFIELRSPGAGATVGDLFLGFSEGEFGRLTRKLRGALGSWTSRAPSLRGGAEAGAASVRGKYTSNEIQGIDGVQGPYRLVGGNNEYPVIVIAGTERVFIDGREVTRGLMNDYTVDYSLGEVTFTSRRRITFASRIVVEFEHTDQRYARNLLGARARLASDDGGWSIGGMAAREDDDEDALQDASLTSEDREILAAAGDSPALAARSGVVFAGPGKGKYELRDTTLLFPPPAGLIDTSILVYNPSDTALALYNATFTFIRSGGGDYEKISTGHYRYAGPGNGSYLPVVVLPFAERHDFANVAVAGSLTGGLSVAGEYAASSFDRNTFSGLDDEDNEGGAYDVSVRFARPGVSVAGVTLAAIELKARQRETGRDFSPLERYDEVEFKRNWNTGNERTGRDLLRDAEITLTPVAPLSIDGYVGNLKRGDLFSSARYSTALRYGDELRYSAELLRSDDGEAALTSERWRQEGAGRVAIGMVVPRVHASGERFSEREPGVDTLRPASYGFGEITPGISVDSVLDMSFSADFGIRRDDSVRNGRLTPAVLSYLQTYGWKYDGGGWVSTGLDLLLQKRQFDPDFVQRKTENNALVRSLTRLTPWNRALQADLFYEVSPEQSAKQERLFMQVSSGTGNYRYAGDLNGNGIVDEPDFRPTRYDADYVLVVVPTDNVVPVLNLKSSARVRFDLLRAFAPGGGGAAGLLSPLSGETYIRVEEKSTDTIKSNVYLLKLHTFRDPARTLQGSVYFLQEINLFESDPGFSVKFRFQQKRGFTQLSTGDEAAYSRERGVRVRWALGDELTNQAELRHVTDDVAAAAGSSRNRSVRATLLDFDWTYRPEGDIESTFGLSLGDANNYELSSAALNAQRLSVSYLLPNTGRVRADFRREEAVITGSTADLPFELTQGRIRGTTWVWGFGSEYRLTRFLESSMRYEGRNEGILPTVHSGDLEVRAFF